MCHTACSVTQCNSHLSLLTELLASIFSPTLCSFHTSLLSSSLISVSPHKTNLISKRTLLLLSLVIYLALFLKLSSLHYGKEFSIVLLPWRGASHPFSNPVFVILSSNIDRSLPVVFTGVHLRFPVTSHCSHRNHFIKHLPQNFQERYLY